jgi:hypothetical protein
MRTEWMWRMKDTLRMEDEELFILEMDARLPGS